MATIVLRSFKGTEEEIQTFIEKERIAKSSVASINKIDDEGKNWIVWYWRMGLLRYVKHKRCIALTKNGEQCTAEGPMEEMCVTHWQMNQDGKLTEHVRSKK